MKDCSDFFLLRCRKESRSFLRELAAFNRCEKVPVNRAVHETAGVRDLFNRFAALEAP
jgi:hypothetical protein